jgi:hypothetical protein
MDVSLIVHSTECIHIVEVANYLSNGIADDELDG